MVNGPLVYMVNKLREFKNAGESFSRGGLNHKAEKSLVLASAILRGKFIPHFAVQETKPQRG